MRKVLVSILISVFSLQAQEVLKVACVGDSITQGAGASEGMSYPDQLRDLLGEKFDVKNFGLGGRTMLRKGNAPYWREKQFVDAKSYDPNIVIIMLGTNDTKPDNWVYKNEYEKDYTDMVREFQSLGSKPTIYVCRPVPVPGEGNFGINEAGILEEIPMIDRVAKETNAKVLDMHAALEKSPQDLPDRVHPNDEGARKMAETVYVALTGKDPAKRIKLSSVFQNHAVLQRDAKIPVTGTAPAGTKITVEFAGQTLDTTADAQNSWQVTLPAMKASDTPRDMVVNGSNKIVVRDVLVGDVWIASGQSNMERELGPRMGQKELVNWKEDAAQANYPLIRQFLVTKNHKENAEKDVKGKWSVCTPESAPRFTAVGFYFARELQPQIKVPLGIIHTSWGGTIAEAWMSSNAVTQLGGKTIADRPGQNRPTALYNAMLAPLTDFPIKGVIWYQGESNNDKAVEYSDVLSGLFADWRAAWKMETLPFCIVQIAPHTKMSPELREAQARAVKNTANTAIIGTNDVGDANDIHPTNKAPVGARLALAARALAYNEKVEFSGPSFREVKTKNKEIAVLFDHAESGLEYKGDALTGFEIAAADGNFLPANAKIRGDAVILSNDQITEPKAARYNWANVPNGNLFNKLGLPAMVFRTP